MANWKKVIVSGSNAELNHITASGEISASGFLFGNLPEGDHDEVVIYNTTTGRLEFKVLNLVNAQRAPELFMIDLDSGVSDGGSVRFYTSFDTASSITSFPITPIKKLSGSLDNSDYTYATSHLTYPLINQAWDGSIINDEKYFDPSDTGISPVGSKTSSRAEGNASGPDDVRSHLITGTSKIDVTIHAQSVDSSTDNTAVPAQSGPAYGARAFDCPPGNSTDTGSLQVYLNDMSAPAAIFYLTASTGNPEINDTIGGITATISPSQSNFSSQGDLDTLKAHRSASFTIAAANQNDGYNFAYILYSGSRGDGSTQVQALTNFVQWFYDTDGAGEPMDNTAIPDADVNFESNFDSNDTVSVSGIKYFNSDAGDGARLSIAVSQSNQYRNIYAHPSDTNKGFKFYFPAGNGIDHISVTQSGDHILNSPVENTLSVTNGVTLALAPLDKDNTDSYLADTKLTASLGFDFSDMNDDVHHPATFLGSYNGGSPSRPWGDNSNNLDVTFNMDFHHPNKTDKNRAITAIDSYLVDTQVPNSNANNFEDFKREAYRITASAYTDYTDPTTSAGTWDSTANIVNGGTGINGGLLEYASFLCYPKFAGLGTDNGNFTTTLGPTQTNDYSAGGGSEATGTRTYYRYFVCNADAVGSKQLNIEFVGSGSICRDNNTTQFTTGGSGFKVFVNRTGGGINSSYNGSFTNGCNIKLGTAIDDQDSIPITTTVDYSDSATTVTGGSTLVPQGVLKIKDDNANQYAVGHYIIVKIEVPEDWSGYINAMAITFGAQVQSGRIIGNTETDL